jgi:ligand-binding sensor domain-containing protein
MTMTMMRDRACLVAVLALAWVAGAWGQSSSAPKPAGVPYVYTQWESYTRESTNGALINDHIFYLEPDGDSLWIGTEGGLVLYDHGTWQSWTEADGLPWRVVLGVAKDHKTGDLWLALFGAGIARFSGGRFEQFTQMNSGLINDVVYAIDTQGDNVWVATTAGISRYNHVTGAWTSFNEQNAPMEEIWVYNLAVSDDEQKVFFAAWGGGILEWDVATETWEDYVDPDGEMEIDLFRDDGLIHVITTAASYKDEVLWASTYFGLSRYDGRSWRGYSDHDSGLFSAFINFTKARSGNATYSCTDKGLAVMADFPSDMWVTYRRDTEDAATWTAHVMVGADEVKAVPTNLDLPNHFLIAVAFAGPDVWIGTGHGLARGIGMGFYEGIR